MENGRTTGLKLALLILLVPLAVFAWWLRERYEARLPIAANERSASGCLRFLATIEEDFRENDRDGNGVHDYWTRDVAGLHKFVVRARSSPAIELIPRSYAEADGASEGARPHNGYYLKALEVDEKTKFGFCAYPADYDRTGRWTFVINETKKLYRVDTQGKPIVRWAPDAATWKPLD